MIQLMMNSGQTTHFSSDHSITLCGYATFTVWYTAHWDDFFKYRVPCDKCSVLVSFAQANGITPENYMHFATAVYFKDLSTMGDILSSIISKVDPA